VLAKITAPRFGTVHARTRLFAELDRACGKPLVWIEAPAGAGKTTLVASWLAETKREGKLAQLWYQVDASDSDPATFFHYLGLAAPRGRGKSLPHLTADYLGSIEAFTRQFFEKLFARMRRGAVLVFDNVQDAGAAGPFYELLRVACETVPHGNNIICLSREAPPAAFARLHAGHRMARVEPAALDLTLDETAAMALLQQRSGLTPEQLRQLHERAKGWAAGVVLLLMQPDSGKAAARADLRGTPAVVFDYFASEVFDRASRDTRDFLAKTALLPHVTIPLARSLTGFADAEPLLAELARRRYFVHRLAGAAPIYEYHPLFREFLLARLRASVTADALDALRRAAATGAESAGAVEDAVPLWREARAWDELARSIHAAAPALLKQGRSKTLEAWIGDVPAEVRARQPWLLHWLGACRGPFNYQEGHALFAEAYALFRERGDVLGRLLSWAGAVEAMMLDFGDLARTDAWIDEFDRLRGSLHDSPRRDAARFPSPEIELRVTSVLVGVLTLRRPERLRGEPWVARLHDLLSQDLDIRARCAAAAYLTTYYLWVGDYLRSAAVAALLETLTTRPDASPLPRVIGKLIAAVHYARVADNERCRDAAAQGLEIARETGVHNRDSFLHSQAAVADIDDLRLEPAAAHLAQMAEALAPHRHVDWCMYRQYAAWHALLSGDLLRAEQDARLALDDARRAGSPFHTALAHAGVALVALLRAPESFDRGALDDALQTVDTIGESMGSDIVLFMGRLFGAHAALSRMGRDRPAARERGLAELREALAIGRQRGYVNTYWWVPSLMASLCAHALAHDIETDYVVDLVRRRSLPPPPEATDLERWPWPLRVRTLGDFAILIGGVELQAGSQGQKKPVELLQALIALGGKEVSEAALCDALWPDAEADQARASLKVALHRLRKLVVADAIVTREGRLTLDAARCQVDAWALERSIGALGGTLASMSGADALRAGERLFALYRGPFLAGEGAAFAISARERLQSRMLRATAELAEHCMRLGAHDAARALYEKLLDIEPLAESAYLGLMKIFHALRRPAEGLAVYQRCRRTLRHLLQLSPSPETETLAASLRALGA
jgi:DNA-binding SARP family transcriptional activator